MNVHRCLSTATASGDPCQQPVSDPSETCWREGHDRKTGRPRHELPDDEDLPEQIEKLAGYGLTQDEIADFFGVGTDETLRNRMKEEPTLYRAYRRGRATYRQKTHKRLRDIGFGDAEALGVEEVPVGEQRKTLVWIEKSQFGAAERHELAHSGEIEGPGSKVLVVPGMADPDEWERVVGADEEGDGDDDGDS